MPKGGARPGAGRPLGKRNSRIGGRAVSKEHIKQWVEEARAGKAQTPLDVMRAAMEKHISVGEWDAAASIARDCAPYIHPKLANVEHAGPDGGPIQIVINKDDAGLL